MRRPRIPIGTEEGMQGSLKNWWAGEEDEEVIRCLSNLHVANAFPRTCSVQRVLGAKLHARFSKCLSKKLGTCMRALIGLAMSLVTCGSILGIRIFTRSRGRTLASPSPRVSAFLFASARYREA